MNMFLKQAVAGAGLALAGFAVPAMADTGTPASASTPVSAVALPSDSDALRSLEHQHRRIVRTAIRQCNSSQIKQRGIVVDPCVISGVVHGVGLADDPQLTAYDAALPSQARYDDRRPQSIWRTVARRHAAASELH
ncbi:hypothetical protein [Pyruvatibacter sp.]|nr:hypothetical protein [Alphaproteobacteria bacterium]